MVNSISSQLTLSDYEILQERVKDKAPLTYETTKLANKLFLELQYSTHASGLTDEDLQTLATRVTKKAAKEVSEWSYQVKFLSALYNLFTQCEAVSSAHKLLRTIPPKEMEKYLLDLKETVKELIKKTHDWWKNYPPERQTRFETDFILTKCQLARDQGNTQELAKAQSDLSDYVDKISTPFFYEQKNEMRRSLLKEYQRIQKIIYQICADTELWLNSQKNSQLPPEETATLDNIRETVSNIQNDLDHNMSLYSL